MARKTAAKAATVNVPADDLKALLARVQELEQKLAEPASTSDRPYPGKYLVIRNLHSSNVSFPSLAGEDNGYSIDPPQLGQPYVIVPPSKIPATLENYHLDELVRKGFLAVEWHNTIPVYIDPTPTDLNLDQHSKNDILEIVYGPEDRAYALTHVRTNWDGDEDKAFYDTYYIPMLQGARKFLNSVIEKSAYTGTITEETCSERIRWINSHLETLKKIDL